MPLFYDQATKIFYDRLSDKSECRSHVPRGVLHELVIHVSEGCNLACSYCFADRGQYGGEHFEWMSVQRSRKVVRAALRNYSKVNSVKFFGGEPFMNLPAIEAAIDEFNFLDSIIKSGARPRYVAISNMTIVTPSVLEVIKKNQIHVTGSIDGPAFVTDEFRKYPSGRGAFNSIDEGIKKMREIAQQPESLEVVFGPQHIRMGLTVIDVHKFLTEMYGIEAVVIHPMVSEPGVSKDGGWDEFDIQIRALFEDYGRYLVERASTGESALLLVHTLRTIHSRFRKDIHCGLGVDLLTATAGGQIYPCYTLIGREEMMMADDIDNWLSKDPSFVAVESLFTSIRKSEIPSCSACDIQKSCRTCPGSMMHVNHSLTKPIETHCNYLIGYAEGVLKEMLQVKEDGKRWPTLSRAMSRASSDLDDMSGD
jgi:uncharacterized protein